MKNLIAILFCFVISTTSFSQNKIISDFYDQYNQLENVSDVELRGWVLKMASHFENEEEGTRILENISFLRVLIMEEGNLVKPGELKGLISDLRKDQFDELMQIRSEGSIVDIYIREDGEEITDVFAVINDPNESFLMISLEGKLKFSDLNKLDIDIDGMEHFEKIPEKKKDVPRA